MSQNLRDLAIAAFRKTAEEAYQQGSKLREYVMVAPDVEAETYRWPIFGSGDTVQRASQAPIVTANTQNKKPMSHLTPREFFERIDRYDNALTNVEAMRHYGMIAGKAVSRQYDEDIIEALKTFDTNAYSRTGLVATDMQVTVAAKMAAGSQPANPGLGAADLRKAVGIAMGEMDESSDLCLVYPNDQFENLAGELQLASSDYMQGAGGVTRTGRFEELYGCKPIFIGQNARRAGHGQLPSKRAYVFHKKAIGLAIGKIDNLTINEWDPNTQTTIIGAMALAGATRINNGGVVEIILP